MEISKSDLRSIAKRMSDKCKTGFVRSYENMFETPYLREDTVEKAYNDLMDVLENVREEAISCDDEVRSKFYQWLYVLRNTRNPTEKMNAIRTFVENSSGNTAEKILMMGCFGKDFFGLPMNLTESDHNLIDFIEDWSAKQDLRNKTYLYGNTCDILNHKDNKSELAKIIKNTRDTGKEHLISMKRYEDGKIRRTGGMCVGDRCSVSNEYIEESVFDIHTHPGATHITPSDADVMSAFLSGKNKFCIGAAFPKKVGDKIGVVKCFEAKDEIAHKIANGELVIKDFEKSDAIPECSIIITTHDLKGKELLEEHALGIQAPPPHRFWSKMDKEHIKTVFNKIKENTEKGKLIKIGEHMLLRDNSFNYSSCDIDGSRSNICNKVIIGDFEQGENMICITDEKHPDTISMDCFTLSRPGIMQRIIIKESIKAGVHSEHPSLYRADRDEFLTNFDYYTNREKIILHSDGEFAAISKKDEAPNIWNLMR